MIAFEILVNGRHLRTITAGEFGMLTTYVMWDRIQTNAGPIHEGLRLMPTGIEGKGGPSLRWPHKDLALGDVVTLRIVEVESPGDPPSERISREEIRKTAGSQLPPAE